MRSMTTIAAAAVAAALLSGPAFAKEGGCLKYGTAGAVVGHMVGSGHGVAGAAAGCAVGAHKRNKAEKEKAAQQQQPQPQSDRGR
jgi:hypothetical protein